LHRSAPLIKRVEPTQAEPQQPELFAVETVQGYGTLGRKERLFVQALFEGKSQRQAAREAGHLGSDEVVDVCASKLVRTAKVQAVMNQAWARSGASIDDTLRQAAELQRRAYQEASNGDTAEKRKLAFHQWREASALIASIHGRLQVKIDANVNHSGSIGLQLAPDALPLLAQLRRESIEPQPAGGRN